MRPPPLTLLPELVDKQQAKAAAGDRFDEAAFDAAAVDGRVPRAVLMEISSWLQALRDGATELDLNSQRRLGDRVGAAEPIADMRTWNHADMRALGGASGPIATVTRSF
jgi:hypothetical protein